MKDFLDKYGMMLAIIATIISITSAVVVVEGRYAKCAQVEMLELRFDQKGLYDRAFELRKRIWQIESAYEGKPKFQWPEVVRNELEALRAEREQVMMQLEAMSKKGSK